MGKMNIVVASGGTCPQCARTPSAADVGYMGTNIFSLISWLE